VIAKGVRAALHLPLHEAVARSGREADRVGEIDHARIRGIVVADYRQRAVAVRYARGIDVIGAEGDAWRRSRAGHRRGMGGCRPEADGDTEPGRAPDPL